MWGRGRTSNSISGIRRYKYWPTICTPRILLFRLEIQSTDTQIKYKPPIVTTRLNRLSYFVVYIFQYLYTNFYSFENSISFAYSCFISESLLYYHWHNPTTTHQHAPLTVCLICHFVFLLHQSDLFYFPIKNLQPP